MNPTKEQPVKWNGEGLPLVGTICECQDESFQWHSGTIVYVGQGDGMKTAVMQTESGILIGESGEFRPIHTHEQIAEEEREKAYRLMISTLADSMGISNIGYRDCDILHILLDAGFRNTSDTLLVLEELVQAYRSVVGLDGAYDPVLIKAEALLK